MQLTDEQVISLETHLTANQLGGMAAVARAAVAETLVERSGGPFLQSDSSAVVAQVQAGGEFLLWITARTEPMLLAEHFPRLAPYSPWGIIDTDALPFPHLAGVEIDQAAWEYVYFSTSDASKQTALLTKAGWPGLTSARRDALKNQGSAGPDPASDWRGGLYYSGCCALPWGDYLPAATDWAPAALTAALAVSGYVAQQGALPELKLQVALLNKDNPFGDSIVKNITLALEFSSALSRPAPLPDELQNRTTLDRRIGLLGKLRLGGPTAVGLTAAGSWPLDGDEIRLGFGCSLTELGSWFDASAIQGIPLPEGLSASVLLAISKERGTLEQVRLQFELAEWKIGPADFKLMLNKVAFEASVYAPATFRTTMARFRAEASLATAADGGLAQLLCTGTYPQREFYFGLAEGSTVPLHDLLAAIGADDAGFLGTLAITELAGRYQASTGYRAFTLAIGSAAPQWQAGELGFHLENVRLGVYGSSAIRLKLSAAFRYTFTKVANTEVRFSGAAEYNGGWLLSLHYSGAVSLRDLATEFGIRNVPSELGAFRFEELDFIADSATEAKYFHGKGTLHFAGEDTAIELRVSRTKAPNGAFETTFSGSLATRLGGSDALLLLDSTSGESSELDASLHFAIAGVTVELAAQAAGAGGKALGELHFAGGAQFAEPLHIAVLLNDLLAYGDIKLPEGFIPAMDLSGIYVSYDGKTREINLVALSTIAGEEVKFFFQYQLGKGRYALGIDTTIDKLSGIPLIGNELKDVQLSDIGFVYLSAAGDVVLPVLLGAGDEPRALDLSGAPQTNYVAGFNLKGNLKLPFREEPLALRLSVAAGNPPAATTRSASPPPAPSAGAAAGGAGTPAAAPSALVVAQTQPLAAGEVEKWFELDAKLGPLHISRVGLGYADKKLYLLIGLDLSLAGLVFSADGLGLGFTPQKLLKGEWEQPAFKLAGLGLSYSSGPVQISGAFLHGHQPVMEHGQPLLENGQPVLVDVYSGGAIVKLEKFTITGLGSYATYKGEPSLFVYAMVEGALGGPAFFFVTGLSIGFGYNRKVNVPKFEHVARFPLVDMALHPDKHKTVAGLLHDLETVDAVTHERPIDIAMGNYWLAVGVTFTSFEIVQGHLLLIAEFGHHLQFTLLGVAELSLPLPPKIPSPSDDLKLVYLKLQMAAVLVPSEGYLSVAGSLTPDSYVLTKDCHITGGFAYSVWYNSPDAAKNGQFVMTAGGYHPAFKVPDYYPQVPRLGYIWQVSDNVIIKGQSYYAITTSCGMAGTSLEVLFEAGDIKAWFIAKADMLVTWHPLSFVAEVYIELGVSVRLNLGFCHKTVSVSISAQLTLWGPPLGGRVRIDAVIVTLEISFGSDRADDKNRVPLLWESNGSKDDFRHLLPEQPDVCKLLAGSGVTQPQPGSSTWVVRAGSFSFTAQSAVPISHLTSNIGVDIPGDALNIRPMNRAGVSSDFTLTLTEHGTDAAETVAWAVEPVHSNVAKALWGEPLTEGEDRHFVQAPAVPSNDIVEHQLTGCRVLAPAPESGSSFGIVKLTELAFVSVASGSLPFAAALPGSYRLVGYPPPSPGTPSPAAVASPIAAQSPGKRGQLVAALGYYDLYDGPSDELPQLAAGYAALFKDELLRYPVPA